MSLPTEPSYQPILLTLCGLFSISLYKSIWSVLLLRSTISLVPFCMFYPLLNVENGSLQNLQYSFVVVFKLVKHKHCIGFVHFTQSNIPLLSSLMSRVLCNVKFIQKSTASLPSAHCPLSWLRWFPSALGNSHDWSYAPVLSSNLFYA